MRRNVFLGGVALILLSCLLFSCEKAPINNAVEQHWALQRFTVLATNEVVECDRLYFGITCMVTVVSEKQGSHGYGSFVARTEYRDDNRVLVLKDFQRRTSGYDPGAAATPEQLMPFGIIDPKETVFKISKPSHKELVLESEYARLELRKF